MMIRFPAPNRCVGTFVYAILLLGGWSGLVVAAAAALDWAGHGPFLGRTNALLALVCGLIAALFAAVFLLRRETIVLPVPDVRDFLRRAGALLEEFGCRVETRGENSLIGHPRFLSFLMGGAFRVDVAEGEARVVGPRAWIERFPRYLRWNRHLELSRPEAENRGERFHKRVRIRVSMKGTGFEGFAEEVLKPLMRLGEQDVSLEILVQSETGISDRFLEETVRPRLTGPQVDGFLQCDLVHRLPPGTDTIPMPELPSFEPVVGGADTYIDRG